MLVECYFCHVQFERKPSEVVERNFCNRTCYVAAQRADKTLNSNYRGGKEVPCDYCGKPVYRTPSNDQARVNHFCSKECQGAWSSQNLVGEKAANYKGAKHRSACQFCGKDFEHWGQKLFCSYHCKSLSQRKINILVCEQCGKESIRRDSMLGWAKKRGYTHHFCSPTCSAAFHVGENSPRWIKDRSQVKSEVRSIRYSTKMKEWRQAVFARDNYTCVKCGDRSRKGHAVTLNAHHIKRFIDFPDLRFDISNGATVCVSCHDEITGREVEFESLLLERVGFTTQTCGV